LSVNGNKSLFQLSVSTIVSLEPIQEVNSELQNGPLKIIRNLGSKIEDFRYY